MRMYADKFEKINSDIKLKKSRKTSMVFLLLKPEFCMNRNSELKIGCTSHNLLATVSVVTDQFVL